MYPRSEWYNSRTVKRDAAHVCLFISIIHCMKNLRLCISKALRFCFKCIHHTYDSRNSVQYTVPYWRALDLDSSFIVKPYHSRSTHHNSPYGTCTSRPTDSLRPFSNVYCGKEMGVVRVASAALVFWFWSSSQIQSDLVIKPIFDLDVLFLHLAYTYTYTYCSIVPNHLEQAPNLWNLSA